MSPLREPHSASPDRPESDLTFDEISAELWVLLRCLSPDLRVRRARRPART